MRGSLRHRVAALGLALVFGQGCAVMTTRLVDVASGHASDGPRRGFSFAVSDAFLLDDGRVLLYARDAGSPAMVKLRRFGSGKDAWIALLDAEQLAAARASGLPPGTVALEWKAWKQPLEPQSRVVFAAPGAQPGTPPSEEDIEACSFRGDLRQSNRTLVVRPPGEPDVPGTPSAQPLRAEVITPGAGDVGSVEPQLALRQLPPAALGGLAGEELRVSFLADATQPAPALLAHWQ